MSKVGRITIKRQLITASQDKQHITAMRNHLTSSYVYHRCCLRWRWWLLAMLTCCLIVVNGHWLAAPTNAQTYELAHHPTPELAIGQVSTQGLAQANTDTDAVAALLTRGQQFYEAAQFSDAVTLWQQANEQAAVMVDAQQQAIAQNYLAIGYQALGNWDAAASAIAQAKTVFSASTHPFLYAQVLNTEGNLQLQTGQTEAALATWQTAEPIYRRQAATTALVRNQINQAHALRVLGHYRQARQLLERTTQDLSHQPDSWLKAQALQSLGITLRAVGDLDQSQQTLSAALSVAEALPPDAFPSLSAIEPLRLSLAKTLAVAGEENAAAQALTLADQVRERSNRPQTQVEAALLQFRLGTNAPDSVQWQTAFSDLEQQLSALPASRWGVYAQVDFVAIATKSQPNLSTLNESATLLAGAVQQAKTLSDTRAQSYALGALGHVYEQNSQWSEAIALTRQALELAQQIRATDIASKWQWQIGRLLSDADNPAQDLLQAIAAYKQAVAGLESIQTDLVAMNPEVQFSFRDQVEPVYRQLVDLLLRNIDNVPSQPQQQRLEQARQVMESLQLAELQNYFRETCLTYEDRSIETIDPQAAVIYSILLEDRIEAIISLPGQPLKHHSTPASKAVQTELYRSFYSALNPFYDASESLPPAQQLYNWLIRPFDDLLKQNNSQTLVFVSDGFLRSLPLAALHDGQHYLIEKYRLALTPGMQLLPSQTLQPDTLKVLSIGLSESRDGFSAIPAVEEEITNINQLLNSRSLLNAEFTKNNFFRTVEQEDSIDILHLATHGQFSSSVEDTFLLAWDGRVNVRELSSLLQQKDGNRQALELMVLSACQTASGDARAALGIAGFAVRSGARSTLATLWSVDDQSTAKLMLAFYEALTRSTTRISRSAALQQAQLALLDSEDFSHPYFWAPFVMIGNWQ